MENEVLPSNAPDPIEPVEEKEEVVSEEANPYFVPEREGTPSSHLHSGSYEFWDAVKQQKQDDLDKDYGFTDLYGLRAKETHLGNVFNNVQAFQDIPGYKVDREKFSSDIDSLGRGADDQAQKWLVKATSPQDYDWRMDELKRNNETNRILGNYGIKGATASILADMTDPVELSAILATSAATYGASTIPSLAKLGHKAYKSSLVVGGLTAAEGASFEQLRNVYSPAITDEDVAMATVFGFGIGGGSHKMFKILNRVKADEVFKRRMTIDTPLTPEEKIVFKEQLAKQPVFGDVAPNPNKVDGVESGSPTPKHTDYEVPTKGKDETQEAFDERVAGDYEHMVGGSWLSLGLRKYMSSVYNIKSSKNSVFNKLADRLGGNFSGTYKLDANGNKVFTSTPFSASEFQNLIQSRHKKERAEMFETEFKRWRSTNPEGTPTEFRIEVGKGVDNKDVGKGDSPIDNAVKVIRGQFSEHKKQAIAYKIKGYEKLENADEFYFSRMFDNAAIKELKAKNPEAFKKDFEELVKKSIIKSRKAGDDILKDEAFLTKLSRGYARAVIGRSERMGGEALRLGQVDDIIDDVVREVELSLVDDGVKVTEELTEQIRKALYPDKTDTGRGHTKSRVVLDEDTKHKFSDDNEYSFKDFLKKDYEEVLGHYDFNMGGRIGLARNGIDQEGGISFDSIIENSRKEQSANPGKMSARAWESAEKDARYLYDSLQGNFHHKSSNMTATSHELLQRLRAWNFFRSMGMSGFAAMMELPIVLAEQSLPILFRNLPRIPALILDVKKGNVSDISSRELNALVGTDASVISGKTDGRFSTISDDIRVGERTKVDETLDNMRQLTAKASLLTPVTDGLRRIATMYYGESWADAARKFKKAGSSSSSITPYHVAKMRQLGVDDRGMKNIYDQINKHVEFDAKGKIKTWNFNKWDADSKELFQLSAHRESTTLVQETDLGSVKGWSRSPIGKTLFQFQSFVLGSMEQQLYRYAGRAAGGDVGIMFKTLAGSMFMGTLIHTARVHMKSSGMSHSDAEKYRDKWLSDEGLVKGVVGLIGMTGMYQTAAQRVFGGTDMLIQNPTLDYMSSLLDVGENVLHKSMDGGDLSEQQWRKALSLLTPYTLLPVTYLNNNMAKHLAD